jgi:cytochrome c peroxidase
MRASLASKQALPRWGGAFAALCLALAGALLAACRDEPRSAEPAPSGTPPPASAPVAEPVRRPATVHEGGLLVRGVSEDALYLADEDRGVVRRVPLPVDVQTPPIVVPMPGPPAAVLALDGRVLVTIRDPGMLLVLRPDAEHGLVETARVPLPADAWGLAVTPDERIAIVTSAWTHRVSAVDLASAKKLWTLDVPREPRGVVVRADGKSAYVTHLVSARLTRIDDLAGDAKAHDVAFPAAPLRTVPARADAATLGYAPVLSPDGARLFVARQALGATGKRAWNGEATVDVLLTADETPLAQAPSRSFIMWSREFMRRNEFHLEPPVDHTTTGPGPTQAVPAFVDPRAAVYRKRTRTLLVASEGTDRLVELDALSVDPSAHELGRYLLGEVPRPSVEPWEHTPDHRGETRCGAPAGVALSEDEGTAFVFCRSSRDLAIVGLSTYGAAPTPPSLGIPTVPIGDEPLSEQGALGRILFYDAMDEKISGGYACAGCHPEGRDDGHVWHEDEQREDDGRISEFSLHAYEMALDEQVMGLRALRGSPRQTPMLAGRVAAAGPYGWKGRSPNLRHRAVTGFRLHRWVPTWPITGEGIIERADAIAEFLRKGLAPPPREAHAPTAEEQRGEALFNDPAVGCAVCHAPRTEYTTRGLAWLGDSPVEKGRFDPELEDWRFKTPSLLYVAGTPPYFHDGSEATLEGLVEHNGNRMGHTAQLSGDDRAALVAFLKTL